MVEDPEFSDLQFSLDDPAVEQPVRRARPGRIIRLAGIAVLALLLFAGVIAFTPSLRKSFLRAPAKAVSTQAASAPADSSPREAATTPEAPEPRADVPTLWRRLNFGAMSADAAQELRMGKYYYDRRVSGNFGLAILHWQQALAAQEGADQDGIPALIEAAEQELARQFSAESVDVFVLLKQGKRGQAVAVLEKMRADFLDIDAPQHVWASRVLSKYRR